MLSFTEIKTDALQLAPDLKVLKSSDYMSYLESQNLVEAARVKAEGIIQEAQQVYEQEKKRGYQDGLEESKKEHAQTIINTIDQCNQYYINVEERMVSVVMSAVKRILENYDDVDVTLSVVQEALQLVSNQKQVTLHVAPEQVTSTKDRVHEVLVNYPEVGYVDVIADARLKNGGCILETEIGIIDASIDGQLAALKMAMEKQLGDVLNENV